MRNNFAAKGGCFEITSSELDAVNSTFEGNFAMQGGVVFAISGSFMQIDSSEIFKNMAQDSSVVYAMSNQLKQGFQINTVLIPLYSETGTPLEALRFTRSNIHDNFATANTIQLLLSSMQISDCEMYDNYAHYVTHGVTLIQSQLLVKST